MKPDKFVVGQKNIVEQTYVLISFIYIPVTIFECLLGAIIAEINLHIFYIFHIKCIL